MTQVIQNLGVFFLYAVTAVFVQNAVFTRGFGVSRLTKLVDDSAVDSLVFCALLCAVMVPAAAAAFFAEQWLKMPAIWYRGYVRPLAYLLCVLAAFFVVYAVLAVLRRRDLAAVLCMASLSCAVLGPLLITSAQNYSFVQTMGFAAGSGIGYAFAVVIVTEGRRRLSVREVPSAFRGLPINLLYIGILALAIYGLTGHALPI